MKQFPIIACGLEWADSCLGAHRTVFVSALTGCRKSLCAQTERRNKSMRGAFLQWAVSGVGLPCGKARLFRWKMVLRLVSPALARGCPACRTAWFMRVVISAVATWINHVARIKLLLNDAQHFPQVPQPPSGVCSHQSCDVDAVASWRFLVDPPVKQLRNHKFEIFPSHW